MKKIIDRICAPVRSDYAAAGDILRVFCCFMVAWYRFTVASARFAASTYSVMSWRIVFFSADLALFSCPERCCAFTPVAQISASRSVSNVFE